MICQFRTVLLIATMLSAGSAPAQDRAGGPERRAGVSLEQQFQDPPNSARPRVWWHWMNGNITKDGIAKDLDWMHRVGIGGLQNFDAAMATPVIVDKRLVYMTPEWKDAFRFAASEADRLGLELAIASSPGWSETGGPWVTPQDGLKKLVWSQTDITGGSRFTGRILAPPSVTGPYQSIAGASGVAAMLGESGGAVAPYYADVAVLAFPIDAAATEVERMAVTDTQGKPVDTAVLTDGDLASGVPLAAVAGTAPSLTMTYPQSRTIRSARLFMPGAASQFTGAPYLPRLEASEDGKNWRPVADIPLGLVPTTVGFAPVSARAFRLVFAPVAPTGFMMAPQVPGVDMLSMSGALGGLGGGAAAPAKVTDLQLSSEDRIDRAEAKAGYTVENDYFALAKALPEVRGVAPDKVVNLTGRMRADGSLDWTPPAGRWRVLRLGYSLLGTMNHPATPEATGLEVDKYDGPAVRRYLEHYISMYKDAAGPALVGKRGVRALLTDSIEVGAANWTPRMVDRFRRLRGYDPTPWLPALTGIIVGTRAESDKFLYDFRRTLADLMASEHYGTVAKVAHENGLIVYGEALENGRPSLGDDMEMRSHADVPMAALWTYSREAGPQLNYLADMKGASSVAHVLGQNLVAAESMTSMMAPWAYGPRDLKRVIDLEFATGINRPVVHTSVHVPTDDKKPGLSLAIFGQYFNRNEAWAELARPWVDYIARNALMLQQGRNVADIAYFYGEEAPLTGLYSNRKVPDAPKTVAYDFLNAASLMRAVRNEGTDLVTSGGARYRALYLGGSSRQMTLPTLRKLAALVEGGATVIGPKPVGDPSLSGDATAFSALTARLWPARGTARVGKGRVIASLDVEAAMTAAGIRPDFHYVGAQGDSQILFVHRRLEGGGDSYFLANRLDRPETFEARFRVTGKAPELWHAETGTSEPVSYRIEGGETVIQLTMAGDESIHVVFRKAASAPSMMLKKLVPMEVGTVDDAWQVAFEKDRGAPASATFATLAPLNENTDAGIRYFSGIATYGNGFSTPRGWKTGDPLWLDLGDAKEIAEVSVNGQLAGYAWHAPYRIDISKVAKPGQNSLTVRVANLWVNRMIGDRQPGAQKVTWTPFQPYLPTAPLRPSGLIGPVKLMGQQ